MTPLDRLVRRMIAQTGPVPVSWFMALALQHPEHGYYRSAAAIGRSGDFITAPEVSQVFGELVGLWLAGAWDRAGRPDPCILCEAGPGRGVLMADALRAVRRVIPGFAAAARVCLIESNETLRAAQAAALDQAAPVWVEGLDGLPDGPLIMQPVLPLLAGVAVMLDVITAALIAHLVGRDEAGLGVAPLRMSA